MAGDREGYTSAMPVGGADERPHSLLVRLARGEVSTRRSRVLRAGAAVLVVGMLVAEGILIAPYVGRAIREITHPVVSWLLIAVLAEVISLFAAAHLQRRMLLIGGTRVPVARMTALYYSANAVSLTLPAGPALGSGYTFRKLRAWGASAPLATFTLVASGALSTLAFGMLVVAATLIQRHNSAEPVIVSLIAVGVLAATIAIRWVIRRPDAVHRLSERLLRLGNRLLRRHPERGKDLLHHVFTDAVAELRRLKPRHRDWALGLTFAVVNWTADLGCLLAACHAVGAPRVSITLVAAAYVAGMSAAGISLLPGGLGVVDAAMILALSHGHVGVVAATAAVVLFRLVSYAFNVALGWLIWVATWHMHRHRPSLATDPALAAEGGSTTPMR